jgi:hypothetical protein
VIDTRAHPIEIASVPRPLRPLPLVVLALLTLAAAPGCSKARCTAELTDGSATYKGVAEGKKGQPKLDKDAARDACRQMCAAKSASIPDACAARCVADIDGAKLGVRTTCTDR